MDNDQLHDLVAALSEVMIERGYMLTLAESCTGGLVSSLITDMSGSSTWFDSGMVTYSNQAKQDLLGVQLNTLEQFGAVSEQVALEMAQGALKQGRADVAISITGIAGPNGGTKEKPVGTVCFAWAMKGETPVTSTMQFQGDRQAIRQRSALAAMQNAVQMLKV